MANENTRFIRAGRYGTKSTNYARVTGNGTKTTPHNIETLDWEGNIVLAGGISCGGAISTSRGGISCAGDIETSNGDIIATGDGVVGGRFDAGGGGSFGGNLGVTGDLHATGSIHAGGATFTGRLVADGFAGAYFNEVHASDVQTGTLETGFGSATNGILSHKPVVLDGTGTDGDVRISGHFYDADGAVRMSGSYINDVRINKYYQVETPGVPFWLYGLANIVLLTEYPIATSTTTNILVELCEALVRLGFYSTTDPDEKDIPFTGYILPASGYSRRGRNNVSKIVVGVYCSNYDPAEWRNNVIKTLCYDVVNSAYSVETWKGYMTPTEEGTSEGSITNATSNSYQALTPPPTPTP